MQPRTTILVVEDSVDLRHLFVTVLSRQGFQVLEARDGFEALSILAAQTPDLVMLDLGLPVISGREVRELVAANAGTRNIPVVVVTGDDDALTDLKGDCVLRKPVMPDQLVSTVRRCLLGPPDPL
jgi:CheY-like chemotaxis protein